MTLIPMRPKEGKFELLSDEKDGLTYYILSGCPRETAFLKFVRPDFIGRKSPAAVKAAVTQFFASKEAKAYMEAYKKTIEDIVAGKNKPKTVTSGASMEERKARAKTKAMEFAMNLAENIDNASDPEFVMKLLDKVGILDGGDEVEEKPRRYLPVTCSECEYRKFVEENCEHIEDGTEVARE